MDIKSSLRIHFLLSGCACCINFPTTLSFTFVVWKFLFISSRILVYAVPSTGSFCSSCATTSISCTDARSLGLLSFADGVLLRLEFLNTCSNWFSKEACRYKESKKYKTNWFYKYRMQWIKLKCLGLQSLHIRHKIMSSICLYIYVLHPDHNWVPDHFSLYQSILVNVILI